MVKQKKITLALRKQYIKVFFSNIIFGYILSGFCRKGLFLQGAFTLHRPFSLLYNLI